MDPTNTLVTGPAGPAGQLTETTATTEERTLVPVVARYLRSAIFSGELPPGSPIRQEAIARELSVSRHPVREALRQLESEGLVLIRPHSGARVAVLDFDECVEIYKIRERLEPLAFGESVGRLSEAQLAAVSAAADRVESLVTDLPAWLAADREFHLACYQAKLPRVLSLIVGYWNTTQHFRRVLLTTFTEEDFRANHAQHRVLVDLLQNGSQRAGEDAMRAHIEQSRLRLERHRELFDR